METFHFMIKFTTRPHLQGQQTMVEGLKKHVTTNVCWPRVRSLMNGDKTTKFVSGQTQECFMGPKISADIAVMIAGTTTETAHGMAAETTAKIAY